MITMKIENQNFAMSDWIIFFEELSCLTKITNELYPSRTLRLCGFLYEVSRLKNHTQSRKEFAKEL